MYHSLVNTYNSLLTVSYIDVFCFYPHCCNRIPNNQLSGAKVYDASLFEVIVHRVKKIWQECVMPAYMGSRERWMLVFDFLHLNHSGTPVRGMVPPTYRVRLPTPREPQRLVSMGILNPMKLTKKMNFHTCLGFPKWPHFNPSNNAVSSMM